MNLADEIRTLQQELVALAEQTKDPLRDPEIYEKSCKIDELIVRLIRETATR